jgi:hypothetical protein
MSKENEEKYGSVVRLYTSEYPASVHRDIDLANFAAFLDSKRGTCETCKHGGDCEVQCAGQGYVNALLGFGKFGCIYHVEKEAK